MGMSHSRGVGAVFAALALGTALASGAFAVADAGPRALAPVAAPRVREGSAVALAPGGAALYVASEEHGSIHVFRLPDDHAGRAVRVPGAPANLVVLGTGEVLATIRDPGLLLVLRPDAQAGLVEEGRVPVAADAWGLAASKDGALAYVTSAWTRTVTAIDVARREVLWSVPVAREPRGIVAHPAGPIYVSHLTSGSITRIDVVQGQPVVKAVALPPSPLRTPRTGAVDASLGYALALSPDGTRLYAPRQALGVVGFPAWFGAATVDVLLVPQDEPLAPMRAKTLVEAHGRSGVRAEPDAGTDGGSGADAGAPTDALPMPHASTTPFAQPRAIVYSASARSVIVAGEGDTGVHAFDALAPDPTLHPVASPTQIESCIAPSAVALSEDESVTYVYCRASFAVVALADYASQTRYEVGRDPLEPEAAAGRKLFYTARRDGLSEGFACSGCHPEGRDDGHVWHEVDRSEVPPPARGAMAPRIFVGGEGTLGVGGVPRQTPMLAGRLRSPGPYGWLGLDADLDARIATGAALHRWQAWSPYTFNGPIARQRADLGIAIGRLAAFVRAGLVAPPRDEHTPTDLELRGKALFESKTVACASCHASDDSLPAMVVRLLPLARRAGFDAEDAPLKAPSLRFLSGTPPYLHDGSAATLAELLDENRDRMGHTNQLNAADRAALVAYLETL
jgi:DNA-binding beta-propeller fold protein YncE/mono/diheme cytochrome c family protein